jgi:magnesium-transporting ATPase (P-type)
MFYLLNSRFLTAPALSRQGLSGNRVIWLALGACLLLQLGFVHLPPLQAVFGSRALSGDEWSRVVLVGLAVFVVAESEKWLIRRTRPGFRSRF